MVQKSFSFCLLLSVLWVGTAAGQQPQNGDFLSFIKQYSSQTLKKDEFETTDAYKTRLAGFVGRKFIVVVPTTRELDLLDRKALSYNADTQTLTIQLIGNGSVQTLNVIDSLSPEGKAMPPLTLLGSYTKFYLAQSAPRKVREYPGSNAFGATARVTVLLKDERAMALSNVADGIEANFPKLAVQLAPDEAQKAMRDAKWRLEVETILLPGQKNFVLDDGFYHAPTIDDPTESAIDGKTIMVVLDRADLFDPHTGKIYGTFDPSNLGQQAEAPPQPQTLSSVAPPTGSFAAQITIESDCTVSVHVPGLFGGSEINYRVAKGAIFTEDDRHRFCGTLTMSTPFGDASDTHCVSTNGRVINDMSGMDNFTHSDCTVSDQHRVPVVNREP